MIRAFAPLLALGALLLAGLGILLMGYKLLPLRRRLGIKARWSQILLLFCGVKPRLIGDVSRISSQSLIVLNHVSWLDIFVVNAFFPCTFIAKSEIRSWPLVGWLVSGAGTIFVERGNRRAVSRINDEVRKRLADGERIAFFPEGTTSRGFDLLPFHSSLFAAALDDSEDSGASYQVLDIAPIALRFYEAGKRSDRAAYVDEDTLMGSIYRILSARDLCVELEILDPIRNMAAGLTRQDLARQAHERIRGALLKTS